MMFLEIAYIVFTFFLASLSALFLSFSNHAYTLATSSVLTLYYFLVLMVGAKDNSRRVQIIHFLFCMLSLYILFDMLIYNKILYQVDEVVFYMSLAGFFFHNILSYILEVTKKRYPEVLAESEDGVIVVSKVEYFENGDVHVEFI
ncbi:hypothetical protein CRE_01126 [Caenorhabditis remanei]|uniref:Uncharacterized protein n=1 Tax=Caenorhabditis remanei TaxID=31234 RepID=E3MWK5_CAERE|nr:hypothetical protein CRE_01126 [Caenorhabditis remanei]